MAWAVNVCIVTLVCFILNVSCVNCDTTLSLFRSLIDVSVINEISIAGTLGVGVLNRVWLIRDVSGGEY